MLGSPSRTAKLSSTCQLKSQFSEGFEGVGNTCDTENVLYGYAAMYERKKTEHQHGGHRHSKIRSS
jgi:hypothetical protein